VVGFSNTLQKKIVKGKETDRLCIRIYVRKKLPESMLRKDEIIPKELEGVCTDVVEVGTLKALAVYTQRYRPTPCGVSTSRADERAAGTIGWWVVDEDGNVYMISNNHVWAKENDGKPGDKLVQPGVLDGGDPEKDVIAELYDFVPILFSSTLANYVDVAVARPIDISQTYMSIMEIGGVTGKRDPSQAEQVCKVGRSTGKTCGSVSDISATVTVEYSKGQAIFEDVFFVTSDNTSVLPGDSGSPVVGSDGKFLGLLFAGNDSGTLLVACKQSRIEQALQQKLGKKVWILVANSWPPFRVETVVQVVYPTTLQNMAMSLGMTVGTLMVASALASVIEAVRVGRKGYKAA